MSRPAPVFSVEEQKRRFAAEGLLKEAQQNHELSRELTPRRLVEYLLFPAHMPIVGELLGKFGTVQAGTYQKEWKGDGLGGGRDDEALLLYQNTLLKAPKAGRLGALCFAHAGEKWKQLWEFTNKELIPRFGFNFDMKPDQPGNFHLLFKWLGQNIKELAPLVWAGDNLAGKAALIAVNRGVVGVANSKIDFLAKMGEINCGKIDLETESVGKAKDLNPKPRIERMGETTVSRRFEELFVLTDWNDQAQGEKALGLEPGELGGYMPKMQERIQLLQLLMLGCVYDLKSAGPIDWISKTTGVDVGSLTEQLHTLVMIPEQRDLKRDWTDSLEEKLGYKTPQQAAKEIMSLGRREGWPDFGAASRLVLEHTRMKLSGKNGMTEPLEKLMYLMNQLVVGSEKTRAIGFEELLEK